MKFHFIVEVKTCVAVTVDAKNIKAAVRAAKAATVGDGEGQWHPLGGNAEYDPAAGELVSCVDDGFEPVAEVDELWGGSTG